MPCEYDNQVQLQLPFKPYCIPDNISSLVLAGKRYAATAKLEIFLCPRNSNEIREQESLSKRQENNINDKFDTDIFANPSSRLPHYHQEIES
mgnify:CR=1 FL=1